MKFLCLIYQDESIVQKLSKDQFEKIRRDYIALAAELKNSGRLLGNHALQPTRAARTVRVRDAAVMTTDGPFSETKEQLGGYFLLEAKDINEATELAAKIPSAQFGSIEVRPVWEL
jgi:hypothetical protein